MSEINNEISSLILSYLIKHKLTQKQFAEKLGVSPSIVNSLIKNRCALTDSMLMRLNKVFKNFDETYSLTSGQIIKKAMKQKGVGVGFISQYARISVYHMYSIIEDKRSITVSAAIRIANALKNITANELLHAQVDRLVKEEYEKEKVLAKPIKFSKLGTINAL